MSIETAEKMINTYCTVINKSDKGISLKTLRTETYPVREYRKQARGENAADDCLGTEAEK